MTTYCICKTEDSSEFVTGVTAQQAFRAYHARDCSAIHQKELDKEIGEAPDNLLSLFAHSWPLSIEEETENSWPVQIFVDDYLMDTEKPVKAKSLTEAENLAMELYGHCDFESSEKTSSKEFLVLFSEEDY